MSEPFNEDEIADRLSKISTQWSLVFRAHDESTGEKEAAMETIINRYSGAVFRYLLGAVRKPDVADDLAQEFVIRFLRGNFHRVDPKRGRFRNYVKKVLINLLNDHFKSQRDSPRQFAAEESEPEMPAMTFETDESFEDCLRDDLLNEAWLELKRVNANYHAVLLARVENPDLSAREIGNQLSSEMGKEISADWVRKTTERARGKFSDLLIDQVRKTLDCASNDELSADLKALGLLSYCQSTLPEPSDAS